MSFSLYHIIEGNARFKFGEGGKFSIFKQNLNILGSVSLVRLVSWVCLFCFFFCFLGVVLV